MAQELLLELHRRGIRLRLADDRLEVVAPTGSLTPQLRDELREQRNELIALLRRADIAPEQPDLIPDPAHRYDSFPLTDIQQAYVVGRHSAFELGGIFTHTYFELQRDGLDLSRLTDSLQRVIDRHDMLRVVVQADGRQRVLATVDRYDIAVDRLAGLGDAERDQALALTRDEMSHRSLAPEQWPLFEIRASVLREDLVRLHFNFDNLIIDAASLGLLFNDWQQFYEDPAWAPEPVTPSFRDCVLAEEAARESAAFKAAETYWMGRIESLPAAPTLPLAKQPAQVTQPRFDNFHDRMPAAQWSGIKQRCADLGLTASAVLITAFSDVLRMWSQQHDVTLDLTLLNRPVTHPEIGKIVGDFTSVTLLAVEADAADTFTARVRRASQQLLRDLEHLSYSGVRVVQELGRRSGGGPGAVMPIVFNGAVVLSSRSDTFGDLMEGRRFFGELLFSLVETPQVWLDHQASEDDGDLLTDWHAVVELFPPGLLEDMVWTYRALLDRLCADPGAWDETGRLVPLPRWQLDERIDANATASPIPARTLFELVESQAARKPEAVAVICDEGEVSYRDVVGRGWALAGRLLELGARKDTLVGVVIDKGHEQVSAVLGITRSGAAYLPIDPSWPDARRAQLLKQGAVRVVVTTPALRDELSFPPDVEIVTFADPAVRDRGPEAPTVTPSPEDLAYVIFTSGSTGQPKGVMIDHAAAANTIQDLNDRFAVGTDDRVLALSALSFDLSVFDIFGTLAAGATIVMPPPGAAQDPACWSDLVARHGVTVWNSVPALMQVWMDAHQPDAEPPGSRLRLIMMSGDWIPVTLPDTIHGRYPTAEVFSLGGATEASIWSVIYPIGEVPANWSRIPYGKPLANQTMHVLNDRLEPCPVWSAGEIFIGGIGVARGYWADPARTAERFVTHPVTGERLYRTGDLGYYRPGGDIEFLGRQDFQVKLNGYRIELGEIGAVLRRQPGVGEAVVTVQANPDTGRRQLVAYVLPEPAAGAGNTLEASVLRQGLDALLPDYMIPHHYLVLDKLPLTANGKVDVPALPTPWSQTDQAHQQVPADDLEQKLLSIWQQVLGRDDFGVEGNVFELGGDSLHAVQILGRLREELGVQATVAEGLQWIFESPTIAQLSARMRGTLNT